MKWQAKRCLVAVVRDGFADDRIQGYVLSHSKDLLLFQHVADVRLDGLMVIRIKDITSIGASKTDHFQHQMLSDNGVVADINFDLSVDLSHWHGVIQSLAGRNGVFIVEEELDDLYFIGTLCRVSNQWIKMWEFTGAGRWVEEPTQIHWDDVTCVRVGDHYSQVYQDYLLKHGMMRKKG